MLIFQPFDKLLNLLQTGYHPQGTPRKRCHIHAGGLTTGDDQHSLRVRFLMRNQFDFFLQTLPDQCHRLHPVILRLAASTIFQPDPDFFAGSDTPLDKLHLLLGTDNNFPVRTSTRQPLSV